MAIKKEVITKEVLKQLSDVLKSYMKNEGERPRNMRQEAGGSGSTGSPTRQEARQEVGGRRKEDLTKRFFTHYSLLKKALPHLFSPHPVTRGVSPGKTRPLPTITETD